jgi:cytosine/adenosine deaminase-related metal-dependent hydrolase
MTSVLLENCRLLAAMDDAGTEIADADVAIRDGAIVQVGGETSGEFDRRIDCRNFVALPGFVNTHHHLYQTLTRAFPESRGQTLFPWLRLLYPIWAGLDEDMIAASTRAGLAELALSGCTTSADHLYVFPPGSDNFMDAQIEAARDIGVRFHPTRGSMDLSEKDGGLPPDSVVQTLDQIMADSERVISAYHDSSPGAMVRIGLAPCSPFSVTPELMRESAALARQTGVRLHTHIAETMDEDAYSRAEFGVSPIELLGSLGWLDSDVWVAHCVHPTDSDVGTLAGSATSVAHCPTSNMLLGSGLAPVRRFLDAGITVGLGVDGSASNDANDMRQEVKQAVLAARVRDGAGAMPVRDALRLATRGGAATLGRDDIGSIEEGKAADVVLFDATALQCAGGEEDLLAAVVLGSTRPAVVIVNGNVIVEDGHLVGQDEGALAQRLNQSSKRLMAVRRA